MANRERGEMTLQVGDRRLTLKLTTNACCELEDVAGLPFDEVMAGIRKGRVKAVRWLLWAALREHHPDIARDTPDGITRIGTLIDEAGGLVALSAQIQSFTELNAAPAEVGEPAGDGRPPADAADPARTGVPSPPTVSAAA